MTQIKTVGQSGQISLGQKFAGQTVIVDEIQSGVWMVKVGRFIPDNEIWLHTQEVETELDEAIIWAKENLPQTTDIDALEAKGNL